MHETRQEINTQKEKQTYIACMKTLMQNKKEKLSAHTQ